MKEKNNVKNTTQKTSINFKKDFLKEVDLLADMNGLTRSALINMVLSKELRLYHDELEKYKSQLNKKSLDSIHEELMLKKW